MRLALGLLMFITAVNVGSFALPSPLNYAGDLLNGLLVYMSFKKWRKLKTPFNIILTTWILLGVYIGFLAINSDYVMGLSTLMESLRELYPFGLMIYITCLLEPEDFEIYINFLHLLCIAGCALAIAQSLYGVLPIFESGGFYHEGHSGGQRYEINGFLTRIALPTIYLIQVMFLYNVYNMILNKTRLINIFYFVLYLVAILIAFSRSSWAGLAVCVVLALFITFIIRREKFQRAVSFILLGVLCVSIVLSVVDTPMVNDIKQLLVERVEEMFYDLEKKEGNLASRLSTIEMGMKMYETSPWTGIDLNLVLIYELYQITDVGYLYALLTVGLIGLVLLSMWYLFTVIISYNHILKSGKKKDTEGIILSMLLFTNIIFFIIIQQTNQFVFSTACLSITTGLFLVKFNSSRT